MRNTAEAGAFVPAVTVGLPVFNGETFLEVAISSVLAQTFDDLELVICDNASTDRTEETVGTTPLATAACAISAIPGISAPLPTTT